MKSNKKKRKFFTMFAFASLAFVLVLGTTVCIAKEGNSEVMEDVRGIGDEVITETVEKVAVVEPEAEVVTTGMSLSTDKEVFSPGEVVMVLVTVDETISADAFVGMVAAGSTPESVESVDYLAAERLKGMTSSELLFTVPVEAGEYELRLIDGDAVVLAISFVVE